ncbi:MAG: HDIG domain-containing protein [Deltaproteobacteria bacterium]|nr:HDIG domain-containing protein [Deltaproteobacteria bacterium]
MMSTHTEPGISRKDAFLLLTTHLKNEKLVSHCLATEAIMRELAPRFDQNPEMWAIAGLLHDIDYEITDGDPSRHGREGAELLLNHGVSPAIADSIQKHNAEGLGLERTSVFDHALACAETITGMIAATALVYPDKKIASVKPQSVTKRMKTPHFARSVSRDIIMECEIIGIPLPDFVAMSLKAMAGIAESIGL